jgi:hypothetical protein
VGGTRRNNRVSKGFLPTAIPLGSNDDAGRDLPCSCAPAASGVFDLGSLTARALTTRFPAPCTERSRESSFIIQRNDI